LEEDNVAMPADETAHLRSRLNGMLTRLSTPVMKSVRDRASAVAHELEQVVSRL